MQSNTKFKIQTKNPKGTHSKMSRSGRAGTTIPRKKLVKNMKLGMNEVETQQFEVSRNAFDTESKDLAI